MSEPIPASLLLTSHQLHADLELCERATPGLWEGDDAGVTVHVDDNGQPSDTPTRYYKIIAIPGPPLGASERMANGRIIAHARTGWPIAIRTALAERARADKLEAAIRKHRDQRGDDRCWLDDEELYRCLPEGHQPPPRDSKVELALCEKYIACRHNPATEYVSPQRRIEELELALAAILALTAPERAVATATLAEIHRLAQEALA